MRDVNYCIALAFQLRAYVLEEAFGLFSTMFNDTYPITCADGPCFFLCSLMRPT